MRLILNRVDQCSLVRRPIALDTREKSLKPCRSRHASRMAWRALIWEKRFSLQRSANVARDLEAEEQAMTLEIDVAVGPHRQFALSA